MIKAKYVTVDDIEKQLWAGDINKGGLPNGFYGLLINTPIHNP